MKERMKHMPQPAAGAAAAGEKKFTRGSHVITLQVPSPSHVSMVEKCTHWAPSILQLLKCKSQTSCHQTLDRALYAFQAYAFQSQYNLDGKAWP